MIPFDTALMSILISQGMSRSRARRFEEHLDHFRPVGMSADMLASYILTFARNHAHLMEDAPSNPTLLARVETETQGKLWEQQNLRYR